MNQENEGSSRRPTLAEMLNPGISLGGSSGGGGGSGRRRMSMAEMLRESSSLMNTTSLPDAVDSAQRKAEMSASNSMAAALADAFMRDTTRETKPAAPAPEVDSTPAPEVVNDSQPQQSNPQGGVRYCLYGRIEGRWIWQCDIRAESHVDGLQQAINWLRPEHNGMPIRLEQESDLV